MPSSTLADRSRSDASLLADRPAARSASSGTAASASGVRSPATAARTRPWIACAAAPGQLLEHDRADERAEVPVGVRRPIRDRSDQLDEVGQHGITIRHVTDGGGQRDPRHRQKVIVTLGGPAPMSPGAGSGLGVGASRPAAELEQTMKATVVRYQAKPERADENQRLIEAVFADLDEREPDGFTYKVFRLEDGVSFVHVVIEHDVDEPDSLQDVPAFQAFVADIADRCDVPPLAVGATIVGGYR